MDALRPHDLLWGMTPAMLPGDAPQWALQVLAQGLPVVVRRAECGEGWVAVGVRGQGREQRFAAQMRVGDVVRVLSPEHVVALAQEGRFASQSRHKAAPTDSPLSARHAQNLWERPCVAIGLQSSPYHWPALQALVSAAKVLDSTRLAWGPTGGVGYQLATGIEVLHAGSDLDLLLRTPQPLARQAARNLLEILNCAPCRIDLQLETPAGAVALREWAGPGRRVLLKAASGARLVIDPWAPLECAA